MALDATPGHRDGSSYSPGVQRAITILGVAWVAFQFWIIVYPQQPLIERPLHLAFALAVLILAAPCRWKALDGMMLAAVLASTCYYLRFAQRLADRIEAVDEVRGIDIAIGIVLLLLLLEGVRRVVGWSLLTLLLIALVYNFAGPWFPGWSRFSGFDLKDTIEIMSMTTNGVLGITTDTSVQFVFYFLAFGVIYGAIGGGKLFIEIGLRLSGRYRGGAAKAAVISSSLMGTISGSAVANAVSVGVFTIPLMRRAGYTAEEAAGIEAISSTGGQLMPPVMGVAAFVMAELLQLDYGKIALAAVIPALAFYFAVFLLVDLGAQKTGVGTLSTLELKSYPPILPRLYLLLPPAALVALLAAGRSASVAVNFAIAACVLTAYLRRESRLGVREWLAAAADIARQAGQVAVPIAAIGIIIAVAVQSNLALRFSARLIEGGHGNVYASLVMTVIGCIIMGMGLPTVAAYIIGAILFVPALLKLGIQPLCAHFFVMYYCVLSMITPPVALASFAAAGIAQASAMRTGWYAFRLSFVLFLIPFGFVFDSSLLGQGGLGLVALAFLSLLAGTAAWAVALVGYVHSPLGLLERLLYAAVAIGIIFYPTRSAGWGVSLAALAALGSWTLFLHQRVRPASTLADTVRIGSETP